MAGLGLALELGLRYIRNKVLIYAQLPVILSTSNN